MKKQVVISLLLIILALALGFKGSVVASNDIQPRTAGDSNSMVQPRDNDQGVSNNINSSGNPYGVELPENEEQGNVVEGLQNIASKQQVDNRGAIVGAVIIITVVIIAGLVMWFYKTNY